MNWWFSLSNGDFHYFQRSPSCVVRKCWTRLRFGGNFESALDGKRSEISKKTGMLLQRFILDIWERV